MELRATNILVRQAVFIWTMEFVFRHMQDIYL